MLAKYIGKAQLTALGSEMCHIYLLFLRVKSTWFFFFNFHSLSLANFLNFILIIENEQYLTYVIYDFSIKIKHLKFIIVFYFCYSS